MLASASGPLGALLLIAPLAAIPVFAIVGVPHFAPVSASPVDDDDVADLGESVTPKAESPRPAPRRSADDLFAPMGEPERSDDRPSRRGTRSMRSDDDERDRPAFGSAEMDRPGRDSQARDLSIQPPAALDQWEVAESPRSNAGRGVFDRDALAPRDAPKSRRAADRDEDDHDSDGHRLGESGRNGGAGNSTRKAKPRQRAAEELEDLPPQGGFTKGLVHPEAGRAVAQRDRAVRPPRHQPAEGQRDSRSARNRNADLERRDAPELDDLSGRGDAAEQTNWRAAADRLKELGIRKYRLESQIETQQFLFRCEYPTPETPHVTELFEAQADTPLGAVQQTLQQIETWLQQRDPADSGAQFE